MLYQQHAWRKGKENEKLNIRTYSLLKNLKFIIGGLFFSLIVGYLSSTYSDAKLAYMDSIVLIFSVLATWMLTQKVLENWLYWLFIDSLAIVLYWKTGYFATVILFGVYITLGLYAYLTWRKEFNTYEAKKL